MYIPSFSEQLQASRSHGAMSKAPPLWRGCVGYWPLSEGGGDRAWDLARGRNGSHNGDPTHVVGRYGRCLDCDGVDDYVEVQSSPISKSNPFSVSIQFKSDIATGGDARSLFIFLGEEGDYNFEFGLRNNELRASLYDWAATSYIFSKSTSFSDTSEWHHAQAIFDGSSTGRVFLDVDEAMGTNNLGGHNDTGTLIGAVFDGNGGINYEADGLISNVIIHDRALPKSQIQQLYSDPHVMTTLRRPVTTVVMGGGGPAPLGFYARRYYDNLLAGGV